MVTDKKLSRKIDKNVILKKFCVKCRKLTKRKIDDVCLECGRRIGG